MRAKAKACATLLSRRVGPPSSSEDFELQGKTDYARFYNNFWIQMNVSQRQNLALEL